MPDSSAVNEFTQLVNALRRFSQSTGRVSLYKSQVTTFQVTHLAQLEQLIRDGFSISPPDILRKDDNTLYWVWDESTWDGNDEFDA